MALGSAVFGGYKKDEVDDIIKKIKDEKKEILLEFRSAQERVTALEKQLAEAQKIITGLEDEIEDNRHLFQKEQSKISNYDPKSLLIDYRGLVLRAKNLVVAEKNLKDKVNELQEENNLFKQRINQLETGLKGKQELINFIQSLSESLLEEESPSNMDNLEFLAIKIKEKVAGSVDIIKERTRFEQQIEKLDRDLEGTKAINKDLTDQYHCLSNELTGVLLKNKELINKTDELQLEVNNLQAIKDKLANSNNLLKEEIVGLKEKISFDNGLINSLKGEIQRLQQSNQELEDEIAETKAYKIKIGDVFQRTLNISATIEERVEEEAKRLIKKRVEDFFNNSTFFDEMAIGKEENLIVEATLALEDEIRAEEDENDEEDESDIKK